MQVLCLQGSPHGRGNTATVLGWVEEELTALGHQVDHADLQKLTIGGCLGCAKCREKPDEVGCVQKDDGLDLLERMVAAQAVIYASPLYFWGYSSQIKAFIDRGYSLVSGYGTPDHRSLIEGQRQALILTAADAYEDNCEYVVGSFERIAGYFKAQASGKVVATETGAPEDLDDRVREQARRLARALVA